MSHKIEPDYYHPDFEISKRFIDFSAELLRLSLLILGGLGAVTFSKDGKDILQQITVQPTAFICCLILFFICVGAALAHRYCATDALTWYIDLLRAKAQSDTDRVEKEKKGFHHMLFLSRVSLITCEVTFGLGVVAFVVAVLKVINQI